MKLQQKIGCWMVAAIVVWQVSLTDTTNVRQADNARRLLYLIAVSASLGLLFRKDEKA